MLSAGETHRFSYTAGGFASLYPVPGGGLGLVWLDGRATSPDSAHPTDNMSLRAAVYSKSGTELTETGIRARVCDCCPTSVATTSDGPPGEKPTTIWIGFEG